MGALVRLELSGIRLLFELDRGYLNLEFQSVRDPDPRSRHSLDMVRQVLTGEFRDCDTLDEENLAFLRSRLNDIVSVLSPARYEATLARLTECEEARADRLFGPIQGTTRDRKGSH